MGNNTVIEDKDIGSITEDIAEFIHDNSFNFKGNKQFPICKQCYYCKRERFTFDEIKLLSDPDLTFDQFQKLNMGSAYVLTCPSCIFKDKTVFKQVRHMFRNIWFIDYREPTLINNPFMEFPVKIR